MSGELTGTRRAYDRCGGCGHARQRHLGGGHGRCTDYTRERTMVDLGVFALRPFPCTCPDFIEPSKEN